MIMEKYKTFLEKQLFEVKHQSSHILFYINDLAGGVVVLLIEFAVILGWKGLPALWRNGSLSKFSCN